MAIDYAALQLKVLEAIRDKASGETSTIRRATDAAPPDSSKPWEPGATTLSTTSTPAIWVRFTTSRIDGTLVKEGDQEVLVPASGLGIVPNASVDSIIRADSSVWRIVRVTSVDPAGTPLLYKLQVRQG